MKTVDDCIKLMAERFPTWEWLIRNPSQNCTRQTAGKFYCIIHEPDWVAGDGYVNEHRELVQTGPDKGIAGRATGDTALEAFSKAIEQVMPRVSN